MSYGSFNEVPIDVSSDVAIVLPGNSAFSHLNEKVLEISANFTGAKTPLEASAEVLAVDNAKLTKKLFGLANVPSFVLKFDIE